MNAIRILGRWVATLAPMVGVLTSCSGECPAGTERRNDICVRRASAVAGIGEQPGITATQSAGVGATGGRTGMIVAPSTATGGMLSVPSMAGTGQTLTSSPAMNVSSTATAGSMMSVDPGQAVAAMTGGIGGVAAAPAAGTGTAGSGAGPQQPNCMPETCDGADNDCDNKVDESLTKECAPMMPRGICRAGTSTCSMGSWSACEGAVEPKSEVCDAEKLDENCDGTSNEGCQCTSGDKQACGKSVGVCKAGMQTCVNGKWATACEGAVDPKTPEACDREKLDENCDGKSNEGCDCVDGETEKCPGKEVGVCVPGMHKCEKGKWGACQGVVTGSPERCDSMDNDCDNRTDEDAQDCRAPETCMSGKCMCIKQCQNKLCGADGCGQMCPDRCQNGTKCDAKTETCVCVPIDCGSRQCGSNGCTGTCGSGCKATPPGTQADVCYTGDCDRNGRCTTTSPVKCYKDADHDSFGDPSTGKSYCGKCPSDTVEDGRDCDDTSRRAAEVFPGQPAYFELPRPDNSFDFNCDGQETPKPHQVLDGCLEGYGCTSSIPCQQKVKTITGQCGYHLGGVECTASGCATDGQCTQNMGLGPFQECH